MQDAVPMSPDSRNLDDFADYRRRELPRLVRANVTETLRREMRPIEESLIETLVITMQECQEQLHLLYLESLRGDQLHIAASELQSGLVLSNASLQCLLNEEANIVAIHDTTISNFLSEVFHLPSIQEESDEMQTELYLSASGRGSRLSNSTGGIFSDSGYSSGKACGCQCPCSCAATATSFSGEPPTDQCAPESFVDDGSMDWANWDPSLEQLFNGNNINEE